MKYVLEDGYFAWQALSNELYDWAIDFTDFTGWEYVSEERKSKLSQAALDEVSNILDEIDRA